MKIKNPEPKQKFNEDNFLFMHENNMQAIDVSIYCSCQRFPVWGRLPYFGPI